MRALYPKGRRWWQVLCPGATPNVQIVRVVCPCCIRKIGSDLFRRSVSPSMALGHQCFLCLGRVALA